MDHVTELGQTMMEEMSTREVVQLTQLEGQIMAEMERPLTRIESLTKAYHRILGDTERQV